MGQGVNLDDCVCVLSDFTLLPLLGGGRKSWYIIIIIIIYIGLDQHEFILHQINTHLISMNIITTLD